MSEFVYYTQSLNQSAENLEVFVRYLHNGIHYLYDINSNTNT